MAYTVTTSVAPTSEPLTLEQVKTHLRMEVTSTTQDALLTDIIKAVRVSAESFMRRALIHRTYLLKADSFDELIHTRDGREQIMLPYPPLSSVTSIKYYDTDGTLQTWSSAQYVVDTATLPGSVCLAYGSDGWPTTRTQPNAVEITFVAGYGATRASVPEDLQLALLMAVTHWNENREAPSAVPDAVKMMLGQYGIWP